jgi:hypothetical protein
VAPLPLVVARDLLAARGATPLTASVVAIAAVAAVGCLVGGATLARLAYHHRAHHRAHDDQPPPWDPPTHPSAHRPARRPARKSSRRSARHSAGVPARRIAVLPRQARRRSG